MKPSFIIIIHFSLAVIVKGVKSCETMKKRLITILVLLLYGICHTVNAQQTDNPQYRVVSECDGDSVRYFVSNKGPGNLVKQLQFYVIEDEIIAREYIDVLIEGDTFEYVIPAKGKDVTFELEEVESGIKISQNKVYNCGTPDPVLREPVGDTGNTSQISPAIKMKDWAMALYGGTLGPGITISKDINTKLSVRFGGTYVPLDFNNTLRNYINLEGAETDVKIRLATTDFKLDYYISDNPKNQFHLIVGGMLNFSELDFSAIPGEESFTIGNFEVTKNEVGSIRLRITPDVFNPFIGVGFGRLAHHKRKIGFKVELGGLFVGSPNVDFTATGLVSPTAEQEQIIERNLRQYYIYPSANIFLSMKL